MKKFNLVAGSKNSLRPAFEYIQVKNGFVYATIETKFQRPKNLPKTPRQKPAKNPLGPKIFCRGKNLL